MPTKPFILSLDQGTTSTRAMVFDASSNVVEPAGVLRKRPLLVQRGRFAQPEPFQDQMIQASKNGYLVRRWTASCSV